MLQHILTMFVNLFSFFSVETAMDDVQPFLAAFFIFSCSIFLEAMSLHDNLKQEPSIIIAILTISLYVASICSITISALGLLGYIKFQLATIINGSSHLWLSSTDGSLLYIPLVDITPAIIAFGFVATLIPLLLCLRLCCLDIFRKRYILTVGFFGK